MYLRAIVSVRLFLLPLKVRNFSAIIELAQENCALGGLFFEDTSALGFNKDTKFSHV